MRVPSMAFLAALGGCLLVLLLAAGSATGTAEETGRGCIVVELVQADGGVCRALVRNMCAGALSVTVDFEVELWRFVRQVIPRRPPGEGHEGEPAAGRYVAAGMHTGQQSGVLAARASDTFEYNADGEGSLIVRCNTRVRATPAP